MVTITTEQLQELYDRMDGGHTDGDFTVTVAGMEWAYTPAVAYAHVGDRVVAVHRNGNLTGVNIAGTDPAELATIAALAAHVEELREQAFTFTFDSPELAARVAGLRYGYDVAAGIISIEGKSLADIVVALGSNLARYGTQSTGTHRNGGYFEAMFNVFRYLEGR